MTRASSPRAGRRILVAIDSSRSSLRALDESIREARACGAEVHVLNVEQPLDDYGMVPAYLSRARHRALTRERAESIIAPALARLKAARVPHESHIAWGDPAASIVRAARRLKCDAIVMGTRGMTSAAGLLLGSVATKVVHESRVPVTLVK